MIVQRSHEYAVVRADIFLSAYRCFDGDLYRKRTDLTLHYFTLDRDVRVRTCEGLQDAHSGDWIIQGPSAELWSMKPAEAVMNYELVNQEDSADV
jgi:hypothetical protein